MGKFEIRKALQIEFEQIYMMGYDTWSDGQGVQDYLNECRLSPKYKKGSWYIIRNNRQLLGSLIIYEFGNNKFGMGSIATPPSLRKQGWATKLISGVINEIESQNAGAVIFLYSDIDPEFYEKFKFIKLPPDGQRYKTTTCMVYGEKIEKYFSDKNATPEYF